MMMKQLAVVQGVQGSSWTGTASDASAFLQRSPMLSSLSEEAVADLASMVDVVEVQDGELLLKEGDPGDSMYLVQSGGAIAEKNGKSVKEFFADAHFGELALL
eukprot:SAG31_NODE_23354_length_506_cov_0.759214_1_plen_102_part_10